MSSCIEKVKRNHKCRICHKNLFRGYDRVHFEDDNYCFLCGYEKIQKKIGEWNNFLSELKTKYGKEIVIARLSK